LLRASSPQVWAVISLIYVISILLIIGKAFSYEILEKQYLMKFNYFALI